MKDNDQPCLFCGCKTKITSRKTGRDWISTPTERNKYDGKMVDRRRFYVICNRCHSKGPLAKTEADAKDLYQLNRKEHGVGTDGSATK